MVLPCSLSVCFFCPFSILINLLGAEGAGLCAYRAFVCSLYRRQSVDDFFSSFSCQGLAVTSACDSSWTFLFTFLHAEGSILSRCKDDWQFLIPFDILWLTVGPYLGCWQQRDSLVGSSMVPSRFGGESFSADENCHRSTVRVAL